MLSEQNRKVGIFVPGTKHAPDARLLKRAVDLVPHLGELLEAAVCFAIANSETADAWWNDVGKRWTTADQIQESCLNFLGCHGQTGFCIDLVQVGDSSGNCWTVTFESANPCRLDYG
jgi:hypothetical protein